ncbi:MAG: iron donor protein CyaY [Alphaproteobacteria bacterium]|nr:iron donor protein CyaY [Alphaproteobacteria bacterium]
MTDSPFITLADSLLAALEDGIGSDAELQAGILTVEADEGTWIINKHGPTRQVWVSSPKSGARHYSFDAATGRWVDTRGGGDLLASLSAELGVELAWTPK